MQNSVVQGAVCIPEGGELGEAFQGRIHPHLVQQLINIKKSEGQRGLLNLTLPELGAPGEIAPQLLIGEVLIGGIVADHIAGIDVVILIARQQPGLLEKNRVPGLPCHCLSLLQRAGSLEGGGQLFLFRQLPGGNSLVGKDFVMEPFRR